jgi:hypothetical protein
MEEGRNEGRREGRRETFAPLLQANYDRSLVVEEVPTGRDQGRRGKEREKGGEEGR